MWESPEAIDKMVDRTPDRLSTPGRADSSPESNTVMPRRDDSSVLVFDRLLFCAVGGFSTFYVPVSQSNGASVSFNAA
jgi:hypothetical protein